MTIDDNSSIYVGGLPGDISDESIHRAFDIYGAVIAIKIVNDRAAGAKCYGFVTFANPRSAMEAIRDMDGKTIDGRVVRVNQVKTRSNLNRESSHRDMERDNEVDGRKRQQRDPSYDRHRNRDVRRERFEDYERETGRGHHRDRYVEEDRYRGNGGPRVDVEQGRVRKRERDWERDIHLNSHEPRNNSRQTSVDKANHFLNRSTYSGDRCRERSMELLDADQDQQQVEGELVVSNQKIEELQKEIARLEHWSADKEEENSQLHEKRQELEDSLRAEKKLTTQRLMQLEKLHKCYIQVRDYDKRLKDAEHDLQLLVDASRTELELEEM